jgi:hypothetical protein
MQNDKEHIIGGTGILACEFTQTGMSVLPWNGVNKIIFIFYM